MRTQDSLPLPKKWGQPKKIESPELLWDIAVEYFQNVDANPWISGELIRSGDLAGTVCTVKKQRPYTWSGLEVFCFKKGYVSRLDEYKSNRRGGYEDYADIIRMIDQTIYDQKFDGATIGDFNANIIARSLNLAERTIATVNDLADEIDYDQLSESALEEIANAKIKKSE